MCCWATDSLSRSFTGASSSSSMGKYSSKRTILSALGRGQARRQARAGLPGNDVLAGITDPKLVTDPEFFVRWIRRVPGRIIELTCHPGHLDATLVGRDGSFEDGQIHRRAREWDLLRMPNFPQAVENAGFQLVRPSQIAGILQREELTRRTISA